MITLGLRIIYQLLLGAARPLQLSAKGNGLAGSSYNAPFRCWPIDIDTFMHMNNASYIRVAELARWRAFPKTKLLDGAVKHGWMFLAVQNDVMYYRPIKPFQKYIVNTSIRVENDKFLYHTHTFLQDPSDVKPGKEPELYATVMTKMVGKERSGKTLRPSALVDISPWCKELYQVEQK
jgi:acyl-CoA thioesterase FadM